MKSILAVVVVVAACLVVFTYVTTGTLGVIPSTGVTAEEAELDHLLERFESLEDEFFEVTRGAAGGGMDTGRNIEYILGEMDAIENRVKRIEVAGSTIEARGKAKKALKRINEFKLDSR